MSDTKEIKLANMKSRVLDILDNAPVSEELKLATADFLAEQPTGMLDVLERVIHDSNRVAASFSLPTTKFENVENEISDSWFEVLENALEPSKYLEFSDASNFVQRVSQRVLHRLKHLHFQEQAENEEQQHSLLPTIRVENGIAVSPDIHRAYAALENFVLEVQPDIVVSLNKGGEIVGQYILRKIYNRPPSKSDWRSLKLRCNSDISMHSAWVNTDVENKKSKTRCILVVDDITRTGKTIVEARGCLSAEFRGASIYCATLVAARGSVKHREAVRDFWVYTADDKNIKMPYDSHGDYRNLDDVNIFGSTGNDIAFTDHELDLHRQENNWKYLKELKPARSK